MSINRVIISGNLTRDPELRRTQSGMAIMSFGVAVNDRRRNQQTGEWEDYANFVDCTMFGNRAESLSNYLSKGTKVAIEGKLRWSQWEREGQKRSKLEVIVDELEFMSSRDRQQGGYQNNGYQQGGYQSGYQGDGGYQAAPARLQRRRSTRPLQCTTTISRSKIERGNKWPIILNSLVVSTASSARTRWTTSTTRTRRFCASS